jgi:putative endonuclease
MSRRSAAQAEATGVARAEAGGIEIPAPRLRLGMPSPSEYHYVYILVSEDDPSRHYTGCTTNLSERLDRHNQGRNPHTAKYAPWRIETAIRFRDRAKARAFERYLKSGSGREFARRHF